MLRTEASDSMIQLRVLMNAGDLHKTLAASGTQQYSQGSSLLNLGTLCGTLRPLESPMLSFSSERKLMQEIILALLA
eukprot:6170203-Amphidinium_carterae.2